MEFNRNHYFLIGILVLLLGIQFRSVKEFVLNEKTSKILARNSQSPGAAVLATANAVPPVTWQPPQWLGYSLISIGSVLILHSLAMKKPGG